MDSIQTQAQELSFKQVINVLQLMKMQNVKPSQVTKIMSSVTILKIYVGMNEVKNDCALL